MSSFATDFEAYLTDLCSVLGHKSRHAPFQGYCQALMLPVERKSVEPLAAHLDPDNVRSKHQSLHHFVADAKWSDDRLLARVTEQVNHAMGSDKERYWLIDDTGIPKKGNHSVGVSHQYCGQLGKQANCQVAVSVSLATEQASLPVAYRLYLPKGWAEDEQRRAQTGVPDDVCFQTKTQIALDQLRVACKQTTEPAIVIADAGYGNEFAFLEGIDELGLQYMVGIRTTTNVWAPWTDPAAEKQTSEKRIPPSRQRFAEEHAPVSVAELAQQIDPRAWRKVTWREGTNESLCSRFAAIEVSVAYRDNPSMRSQRDPQWLLIEWPVGEPQATKYWLSTLPSSCSKRRLVQVAKMRWRVERDYQELKQELGLNHYEGRNWRGFHHHASLCIAAYGFLQIQGLKYPKRKKNLPRRQAATLPEGYQPRGAPENAASC